MLRRGGGRVRSPRLPALLRPPPRRLPQARVSRLQARPRQGLPRAQRLRRHARVLLPIAVASRLRPPQARPLLLLAGTGGADFVITAQQVPVVPGGVFRFDIARAPPQEEARALLLRRVPAQP